MSSGMRIQATCPFCNLDLEFIYAEWLESVPYGMGSTGMPMAEFYAEHDCPVATEEEFLQWESDVYENIERYPEINDAFITEMNRIHAEEDRFAADLFSDLDEEGW